MANRVEFDIEEIHQFKRDFDDFMEKSIDIVNRMNDALNIVRETWQDNKLEKPAECILEANRQIIRMIEGLAPEVQAFLRKQEDWYYNVYQPI